MSKKVEASEREFKFLQKYLNSTRKEAASKSSNHETEPSTSGDSKKDDDWLTK